MNVVIIFIVTLILGVPVMTVLGLATIIPIQIDGNLPPIMVAQALFSGLDKFVLVAVTGFIFAGLLMEKSGITDGLLEYAKVVVGRLKGGYAFATIFASTFFSSLTGSGPAGTAAIGSMTIPLMTKGGYDKGFASAVAASGGTLGIMIPPSNPMIIYALLAGVSVGDMFIAGILPGLITAVLLMFMCYLIARKRNYVGMQDKFTFKKLLLATWGAKWGLIAPVMILGGIYTGIVTPTESSILAVIYALVIGLVNRRLKLTDIIASLKSTAILSGSIMAIVGISTAFGRVLTANQIPQTIAESLVTITTNPILLQFLVIAVMIFVGMWLEPISSLVILTPIFLPVLMQFGVDPIAFGIILTLTTQIAFITPPVAANLFVVTKISGLSLEEVNKEIFPFLGVLIVVLLLVVLMPGISTVLLSLGG